MTNLQTLMIAECPPAGECGPLGALDGDAGMQLARLDPANHDALCVYTSTDVAATQRRCLERTLSIFERRNLCPEALYEWEDDPEVCALVVGRRVVLVGRAGKSVKLPPLRWLRMGSPDEPAEVCYLPHPTSKWYVKRENRKAASVWLAAERARYDAALRSWSTFGDEGGSGADSGVFAFRAADASLRWMRSIDAGFEDAEVVQPSTLPWGPSPADLAQRAVHALCRHLTRIPRWSGASPCSVAAHSLRVALVADVLCPGAGRLGAAHDLSEGLPGVGDAPTPEKRWMRLVSPEFDALHRDADALCLHLVGLADAPPEHVAAVHLADRVAMAAERAAYFRDAPEWLGDVRRVAQACNVGDALAGDVRSIDAKVTEHDMIGAVSGNFGWVWGQASERARRLASIVRGGAP